MAPPVKLTHKEYERVKSDLVDAHGKKILISWVCKRELGFTFREHTKYNDDANNYRDRFSCWYVDFYDDVTETMFRLKYL